MYNDLKFENILLGNGQAVPDEWTDSGNNSFLKAQIVLTDFGLASRWKDKETGEHIPKCELPTFGGNLYFGSVNQLKFHRTSRRDDLHSLMYMMIYLLNKGSIPCISNALDKNEKLTPFQKMQTVLKVK